MENDLGHAAGLDFDGIVANAGLSRFWSAFNRGVQNLGSISGLDPAPVHIDQDLNSNIVDSQRILLNLRNGNLL